MGSLWRAFSLVVEVAVELLGVLLAEYLDESMDGTSLLTGAALWLPPAGHCPQVHFSEILHGAG